MSVLIVLLSFSAALTKEPSITPQPSKFNSVRVGFERNASPVKRSLMKVSGKKMIKNEDANQSVAHFHWVFQRSVSKTAKILLT